MNEKNATPNQSNQNVEFGEDFDLNQQVMETLVATKAGGLITKRLVELGERMLVEEKGNK